MGKIALAVVAVVAALALWEGLRIARDVTRWRAYHERAIPTEAALPALVRGMPQDPDAIRRVWAQRVAARFHDGMPVATLVAQLQAQGFVIWAENQGRGAALVVQKKGHCWENCRVHWDVNWRRDGTRAVEINAWYGDVGVPFDEYFESD